MHHANKCYHCFMKITIQYKHNVYFGTPVCIYECMPGVVLHMWGKQTIHRILNYLRVRKCQMLNFRYTNTGVMYILTM